jgi:hypothetical protein
MVLNVSQCAIVVIWRLLRKIWIMWLRVQKPRMLKKRQAQPKGSDIENSPNLWPKVLE